MGSVNALVDGPDGRPHPQAGNIRALEDVLLGLEESFEWEHMSWQTRDYFWAPEANWDALIAERDSADPVHERFLAAGAAEVTIPVRQGSETNVLFELWKDRSWPGDRAPLPPSDLATALGAEVATTEKGASPLGTPVEGSQWTERLPTALSILQPTGGLEWTSEPA